MRHRSLVVRRYRRALRRLKRLRHTHGVSSWEWAMVESEARALAWVLGVDYARDSGGLEPARVYRERYLAAEMTSPDGEPPLRGMRLTRAWTESKGKRYWLLEVPANTDADGVAQTEYWAAFLPEKYVAEVLIASCAAIFASEPAEMMRLVDQVREADKPTVRDLRGLMAREHRSAAVSEKAAEGGGAA